MGVLIPVLWAAAFLLAAGAVSFLTTTVEGRWAAIFALPQRKTIGQSRFVSGNSFFKQLYDSVWSADRRPQHGKGKLDLATLDPADLDQSRLISGGALPHYAKRITDIALSLTMLLFMLPLLVVVAVLVRIDSPGPAFYRQTRVGFRGRQITVVKFRTMRIDAEKFGAQWAAENDPRITRLGRFLRRTRIDEIPQVWPILTGEMSFVGPRPERPEFTTQLEAEIDHFDLRHRVKPGLTGWAQVNAPYGASVEDTRKKLAYDLYYIKHQSLLLDWFIVIKTLRVAVLGVGSR